MSPIERGAAAKRFAIYITPDGAGGAVMRLLGADTPPSPDVLQRAVGGYIEAVFTVPSLHRGGVSLTGYVNEEGIARDLPWCGRLELAAVDTAIDLKGPLVIVGLDADGNTIGLTADETHDVRLIHHSRTPLPLVQVRGLSISWTRPAQKGLTDGR